MLSLAWWILIAAAAWQARRAWGVEQGVLAFLALGFLGWILPFGWIGDLGAAVVAIVVGYRAEVAAKDRPRLGGP